MKLVVVGAREDGQAHLVLEALAEAGEHEVVAFLDETPELQDRKVFGIPVVGPPARVDEARALGAEAFHVAIGSGAARERLGAELRAAGLHPLTVLHPGAHVSPSARVGAGAFVGVAAVISSGAVVDDLALVAPTSLVSHHVRVGAAASLSPGARLGGRSRLGARALLGLGASVLPDCSVGEDAVVGAGSVVTRDVPAGRTVIGVPGKLR
jgi:sugar O-acyltransferase (sialic acid O-acetyltransferase NeuD family)